MKSIVLAGGCFWGIEKFFSQFEGLKTETGYANGPSAEADYRAVCSGLGHTEAVRIEYPEDLHCAQLIALLFEVIDPTSLNRQGNDTGINYRTGIYTSCDKCLETAKVMLADLQKQLNRPVVVEAEPLRNFVPAEEYHQHYLDKNPLGYCHLPPAILHDQKMPSLEQVIQAYPGLEKVL
ncbi:MAG: peptide-methionine (S)-S-oxide reductase MsrA [Erysipelotrichaceae bacterium]|nr:peptide-methionine (S)-S-oxide reductase MsrA [Erysipelotrichaceae bacterium]